MPKQAMTTRMDVKSDTTVAMVRKFLDHCPEGAKIKITSHIGDRPWDSSWSTIEASWSEEI